MAQQNTDMLDGLQAAVLADAQKKQMSQESKLCSLRFMIF